MVANVKVIHPNQDARDAERNAAPLRSRYPTHGSGIAAMTGSPTHYGVYLDWHPTGHGCVFTAGPGWDWNQARNGWFVSCALADDGAL